MISIGLRPQGSPDLYWSSDPGEPHSSSSPCCDITQILTTHILPSSALWSSSTCALLHQRFLRTSAASIQSTHRSKRTPIYMSFLTVLMTEGEIKISLHTFRTKLSNCQILQNGTTECTQNWLQKTADVNVGVQSAYNFETTHVPELL